MHSHTTKRALRGGVAALAILASAPAFAGAFALREYSAVSVGMSQAGNAVGGGGITNMFWNPAILTMAPGFQVQATGSWIDPKAKLTALPPTPTLPFGQTGDLGQGAFVPAGAGSVQFSENLFVGIVMGAPYGLITSPRFNSASQVYARTARVQSINGTPTVAYRFNDFISVGVGVQLQGFKTSLKRATGVAPNAPTAAIAGDGFSAGATAGVTITPWVGTEFGIGWRSQIDTQLDGYFTLGPLNTPIHTTVKLPNVVTFSASQQIGPAFKLLGSVEYSDWSRFNSFPVISDLTGAALNIGAGPTILNFRYKDSYYFSVGGEYALTPEWTVRGGLGYEISPIDTSVRSVTLPDNDRVYLSGGASYNWSDRLSLDLGYSHIFVDKAKIAIVPGNPAYAGVPYFGSSEGSVDIVSFGLRYKFGDVFYQRQASAAPLVRKF